MNSNKLDDNDIAAIISWARLINDLKNDQIGFDLSRELFSPHLDQSVTHYHRAKEVLVRVNVYDIYTLNNFLSSVGLGVYHSGVEINGREYTYGGHLSPESGIFDIPPKSSDILGSEFKFKTSLVIGTTIVSDCEIDQRLNELGQIFSGDTYHLLTKNCNHFTAKFVEILCGANLPNWINRLAGVGCKVPFLNSYLSKKWSDMLRSRQINNHGNDFINLDKTEEIVIDTDSSSDKDSAGSLTSS